MPDISVITVTYNNEAIVSTYLQSLKENLPPPSEIIVVDNNSSDKTLELLLKVKGIQVVQNKENTGFSKANNLAFKRAQGEYLLLLNPDASLIAGLEKALTFIKEHNGVGIVAPKIMEDSRRPQKSVRKLPTIIGAFKEYFLSRENEYEPYAPEGSNPVEVECVVGACMLIKRSLFEQLGGFDENYFMYYEDLDLCRRIRENGYKIVYFPDWVINHQVGFSKNENKQRWLIESAKRYHGILYFSILNLLLKLRPKKM